MWQVLMSNCVIVLMTVLGAGGWVLVPPVYGRWTGGPGRAGAELAAGEPLLSQACGPSACASSKWHFQFAQSRCWNADPLGVFLARCCWQLLVLPLMSLGCCLPLWVLHVSLTHLATSSTPASALCGLWFLPLLHAGDPWRGSQGWDNRQVDERPVLRLWACP